MAETFVDRAQLAMLLAAAHGSLGGEDGAVRVAAVRFAAVVARRMGDPAWIGHLADAAREVHGWHDDLHLSDEALVAITRVVRGRARLDPTIAAVAADRRPAVRAAVASGLSEFDPDSRALLRQMLHDRHPRVRARARAHLGETAADVPWWAGLLREAPSAGLGRAGLERLEALEGRLRNSGSLRSADRAELGRLPPAIALEVLDGLLTAGLAEPEAHIAAVTAALETPGGLDLLCRILAPLAPDELRPWRSAGAALRAVAARRRTAVTLELARRALTSPRGPPREVPARRAVDVPLLLAQWVHNHWPDTAAPRVLLALLAETPLAATHADVRAELGSALGPYDRRAAPMGARLLRALSEGDHALVDAVGGVEVAERLAARAPPAARRRAYLAGLDADDPVVRGRALDALLEREGGTRPDLARLRAALERALRESPHEPPRLNRIAHMIPLLRPRLLAGELSERAAAYLLIAIGRRAGGVWPPSPAGAAPGLPLDLGAAPGAPVAPPTPAEWAAYRAARAALWADRRAGAHDWVGWGVLPAGDWTEDDWTVVEAVVEAGATRGVRGARWYAESAAEVLRLEGSARARALLRRLGLDAPEDAAHVAAPEAPDDTLEW